MVSIWQNNLICSSQSEPLHFSDSLTGKLEATVVICMPVQGSKVRFLFLPLQKEEETHKEVRGGGGAWEMFVQKGKKTREERRGRKKSGGSRR